MEYALIYLLIGCKSKLEIIHTENYVKYVVSHYMKSCRDVTVRRVWEDMEIREMAQH